MVIVWVWHLQGCARPEPIMLKKFPIVPAGIAQNIPLKFFGIYHIIPTLFLINFNKPLQHNSLIFSDN